MPHIRALTPEDIPAAAALLRRAAEEFILHESTPEDGATFLAEQGEAGIRGFLAKGFVYHVAEVDGESGAELAGFIAIRERSHVYSLYVGKRFHRRGIARQLWDTAREAALGPGHPGAFTVKASNYAMPFYASLGFVPAAPTQASIVRYNPMRLVIGTGTALVDPA
jgi:ribosomal protein S18 acetylase RimI-like enzyme